MRSVMISGRRVRLLSTGATLHLEPIRPATPPIGAPSSQAPRGSRSNPCLTAIVRQRSSRRRPDRRGRHVPTVSKGPPKKPSGRHDARDRGGGHLTHRIKDLSMTTTNPTLVIVDETKPMLRNKLFSKEFLEVGLQEGRKLRASRTPISSANQAHKFEGRVSWQSAAPELPGANKSPQKPQRGCSSR